LTKQPEFFQPNLE
jgi:hypothetical protein